MEVVLRRVGTIAWEAAAAIFAVPLRSCDRGPRRPFCRRAEARTGLAPPIHRCRLGLAPPTGAGAAPSLPPSVLRRRLETAGESTCGGIDPSTERRLTSGRGSSTPMLGRADGRAAAAGDRRHRRRRITSSLPGFSIYGCHRKDLVFMDMASRSVQFVVNTTIVWWSAALQAHLICGQSTSLTLQNLLKLSTPHFICVKSLDLK
ncbi:uncharacterized protein LOC116978430 [Amblyraja radiata]|uniref:uncharacterized protein LOC116978430 n=1 Tax=Amblyraja radiata TaxID=386614 RepID=UPI001403883E|nr:uncharacterized protein LOC116978430 [Amblyraja radiata]